jgi:hypothetical protein
MKKHVLSLFILVAAYGVPTLPAHAEKKVNEEMNRTMREFTGDQVLKRSADVQLENIVTKGKKMEQRLAATIDRLEHITLRMSTRIEKIKKSGGDSTQARELVATVRLLLMMAKARIDTMPAAFEGIRQGGSTSRAAYNQMKVTLREAETHIKRAHGILTEAVGSINP